MIIPKNEKLSVDELKQVEAIAADSECSILEIQGRNRCVYAILGDETKEVMFKRIAGLPFIRKVDRIESPYKLMDRRSALADHRVKVGQEWGKVGAQVLPRHDTLLCGPSMEVESSVM